MRTILSPTVIARRALRIPLEDLELRGELALGENRRGLVILPNGDGDQLTDRMNREIARRLFDAGFATLIVHLLTPNEAAEDAATSEWRFHQNLLSSRIVKLAQWARRAPMFCGFRIGFFASGLCAGAVLAAATVSPHVRAVVCCGQRADLALSRLNRLRADVLVLAGPQDTAHPSATTRMRHQLPASAQVETLPNAGHLLADPAAVDRAVLEAEWWFGRSLGSRRTEARPHADFLIETA